LIIETTFVTKDIINYISTLDTPVPILGFCEKRKNNLDLGNRILLLDGIQDPGNLGTIIRSALAFNVDTIVLSPECVDLYNPKVIRSTQGMLFGINIIRKDLKTVIETLKREEIPIYGTRVEYGEDVVNLKRKDRIRFGLIMGNEGQGVKREILEICDKYLFIDMNDNVESLNVAVATSILLYELNKVGE